MTTMEVTPRFQTCAIHEAPVTGVGYRCPACNRWFCTDCVHFYVLDVKSCPACGAPADVSGAEKHADDDAFPGGMVTVIAQDVIDEMERLGIGEEIFDEVLYAVKAVAPCHRVAYLRNMFADPDDDEDGF